MVESPSCGFRMCETGDRCHGPKPAISLVRCPQPEEAQEERPYMKFYVCWLVADEADAAAIRTVVVTKDRPLTDWPHLATNDFDGTDVNALEGILQPKGKGKLATGGK